MSMNKEQQLFKQTMLGYEDYEEEHFELDRYGNFSWIGTADHFDIWQLCAKAKQAEIDELKAQVAQVPEGFVLVPKENITHFYQDNDEPENCCLDASGFDSLGDCINDGEVMLVNKFTQANISKQQMFGAWCACDPKPLTRFIKEFKLFDTQEEAEKAMIEAQEPAND